MSSVKQVNVFGLIGKTPEDSGYGSGVAALSTANDGWLLAKEAIMKIHYADLGERALAAGGGGPLPRNVPSGSYVEAPFESEFKGIAPTAYAAGVTPPNEIHRGLLLAGHSATFSSSPTPQWTYAPVAPVPTYSSGGLQAYSRGQIWTLAGAYCDWGFTIGGPDEVHFTFPLKALMSADPTDIALPAITYAGATVLPPKATSIALAIGSWTAGSPVVRKITGKMQRVIQGRNNVNGSGYAGFGPGRHKLELDIEVESAALATYNAYSQWRAQNAGAGVNITFTVGSVQYNRFTFTAPQAKFVDVQESADGPAALWTLKFECDVSSPVNNDDYSILIN